MNTSNASSVIARIRLFAWACCCFFILAGCMGAMSRATEIVVIHGCAVSIKGLSNTQVRELVQTAKFSDNCEIEAGMSTYKGEIGINN